MSRLSSSGAGRGFDVHLQITNPVALAFSSCITLFKHICLFTVRLTSSNVYELAHQQPLSAGGEAVDVLRERGTEEISAAASRAFKQPPNLVQASYCRVAMRCALLKYF